MQEVLALLWNGLHNFLVNTIQTMEETGRTVCDVTTTEPWECTMALARHVWDKSRHVEIFLKLLEGAEGSSGADPETTAGASSACAPGEATGQPLALAHTHG